MDETTCLFCGGPVGHQLSEDGVMGERDCPVCGQYEFFYSASTFDAFRDWCRRRRADVVPKIKACNEIGIRYLVTIRMIEQDLP